MTDSIITAKVRARMDIAHTLQHQLDSIKLLEQIIAKRRLGESLDRIEAEADETLDIKQATHEGGQ